MPIDEKSLALRRTLITASDVPAILGIDPHRTPIDVWTEKVAPEKAKRLDAATEYAFARGHALEPALIDYAARQRGVFPVRNSTTLVHRVIPWLGATPDALAFANADDAARAGSPLEVLEAKSVGRWHARLWSDEHGNPVPARHVIAQVQIQLAVVGVRVGVVSADLPYEDTPSVFEVERDDELVGVIVESLERFRVDYLEARKIPPDKSPEKTVEAVRALFPRPKTEDMVAADEADELVAEELFAVRRELGELVDRKKSLEARILQRIGDAEGLKGREWRAKWRWQEAYVVREHTVDGGRRLDLRMNPKPRKKTTEEPRA